MSEDRKPSAAFLQEDLEVDAGMHSSQLPNLSRDSRKKEEDPVQLVYLTIWSTCMKTDEAVWCTHAAAAASAWIHICSQNHSCCSVQIILEAEESALCFTNGSRRKEKKQQLNMEDETFTSFTRTGCICLTHTHTHHLSFTQPVMNLSTGFFNISK